MVFEAESGRRETPIMSLSPAPWTAGPGRGRGIRPPRAESGEERWDLYKNQPVIIISFCLAKTFIAAKHFFWRKADSLLAGHIYNLKIKHMPSGSQKKKGKQPGGRDLYSKNSKKTYCQPVIATSANWCWQRVWEMIA
jgi:hypothetical protein